MGQLGGLPDLEGFFEVDFDVGAGGREMKLALDELLSPVSDVFTQAGIGGESDDVLSELNGITRLIGEGVHALLKQFGVAAFLESLSDVSTAEFVSADIVGRVEVGEDEDAHTLPS
jgi:hypothetical protein